MSVGVSESSCCHLCYFWGWPMTFGGWLILTLLKLAMQHHMKICTTFSSRLLSQLYPSAACWTTALLKTLAVTIRVSPVCPLEKYLMNRFYWNEQKAMIGWRVHLQLMNSWMKTHYALYTTDMTKYNEAELLQIWKTSYVSTFIDLLHFYYSSNSFFMFPFHSDVLPCL